MTQKLIEAALAYGRADAEYRAQWKVWLRAYPEEYALYAESSPGPAFERDVRPSCRGANDARRALEAAAEELYAGSAGILALADEATAREPTAPDGDAVQGPSLAEAINGGGC